MDLERDSSNTPQDAPQDEGKRQNKDVRQINAESECRIVQRIEEKIFQVLKEEVDDPSTACTDEDVRKIIATYIHLPGFKKAARRLGIDPMRPLVGNALQYGNN